MNYWLVKDCCDNYVLILTRGFAPPNYLAKVDSEITKILKKVQSSIELLDIYEDENGEVTVLISETRLMNRIDSLRGQAYKEGKWDFKIDLNL